MKTEYRIAIADDERDTREFLSEVLSRNGHQVVGVACTGEELLKTIQERRPDLVIADVRMPKMDGIEVANIANREHPVPFLMVSAHHDKETLGRCAANHIVGYLVKPISEAEVKTAVTMAMTRYEQFLSLAKETSDLRQALEDRKLVEKAKGIVMKRSEVAEEEAYRRIRKWASHQNLKLNEVCRRVLAAEEVFHNLEQM